jgi:DNA-binding transcriptional regulator YdaS (Cro superfamily)
MNAALKRAVKAAGGVRPLARKLGLSHTTVLEWDKIPTQRLLMVEEITGIPRAELRPDLAKLFAPQPPAA